MGFADLRRLAVRTVKGRGGARETEVKFADHLTIKYVSMRLPSIALSSSIKPIVQTQSNKNVTEDKQSVCTQIESENKKTPVDMGKIITS